MGEERDLEHNKIKIFTDQVNCSLGPPEKIIYSVIAAVFAIGEPIRVTKQEMFEENRTFTEASLKKEAAKSLKMKLLELANSIED